MTCVTVEHPPPGVVTRQLPPLEQLHLIQSEREPLSRTLTRIWSGNYASASGQRSSRGSITRTM